MLESFVDICTPQYAYIMYRPMAVGPAFAPCEVFDPISPIIEARYVL